MKVAGLFLAAAAFAAAAPAFAEGDVAAGQVVFRKCAVCHNVEPEKAKIGPSLFGVVGKKSASDPKFAYSAGMKAYDVTWTEAELFKYLEQPQKLVKGTKMVFVGLPAEKDRRDVIAYLASLK